MEKLPELSPVTDTESNRSGGSSPPRKPTANGLSDSGDKRQLPDISALKAYQGVLGSIIIGDDGSLLACDLLTDTSTSSRLGTSALTIFMNSSHCLQKLGHEKCHQLISKTFDGYHIIASYDGGLVVTLCDGDGAEILVPLMKGVNEMIAQQRG